MLNFNSRGHLTPNKNIESTVEELNTEFVINLQSSHRAELYNNYIKYSDGLKNVCNGAEIVQWINGSFVTKKPAPQDIDVVSFIDFDIFDKFAIRLEPFVYPNSIQNYNVDAYIVKTYPRSHELMALYMGDSLYWMDRFDKTRRNRAGNRYPKGFLEIYY